MHTFYKVIVIATGMLESQIVDERHFPTKEAAQSFVRSVADPSHVAVIIEM